LLKEGLSSHGVVTLKEERMRKFGMSLFAGLMMMGAVACDDGVADKAENRTRCREICSQAKECVDSLDTGECTDDCSEMSKDDGFEEKAEACSKCVDVTDSCKENTAECATKCTGVVVLSGI
jgi:hypothetical protein